MFDEIYKALPPWGQGLLTLLVVGAGLGATIIGLKRKPEDKPLLPGLHGPVEPAVDRIPMWAMMGPVHEVMQTIHDMAETQRNILAELQRISAASMDMSKELDDLNRGQEYTHRLLEEILRYNNLVVPSPPIKRPRSRG